MTRHFLDITDLTVDELGTILDLAQRPNLARSLAGLGVALIFEKPSNRTRHSMEMAVVQLGGHPVYTRGEEVGLDVRETVEDVTNVMAGYHGMLAARVFRHDTVARMAAVSAVPVVNMLSDWSHPLQALADVLTMQQVHGPIAGSTVAYVGDYNNVARSLAEACVLLGAEVSLGCPVGYCADDAELDRLNGLGVGRVRQVHRAIEAVQGATAVHTDTWTSMGQEAEKAERVKVFEGYTVDEAMMAAAAPGAGFYHCMPAYRGYEVAAEVMDGPQSHCIRQAHNRLHAARGALAFVMGER
ncbi:MAG TPA: ornithine carbamoyltransferase [Acidimicrobiaceae bacterium]|nr:ornithine carbamoyltransferase [Acidimicrobiaceae bacterium]